MSHALILIFIALAVASRRVKWLGGLGFTFVVLATGAAAMMFPTAFISWGGFEVKTAITPLVQVILLGMGLTLTLDDFRRVFTMPRGVILCCVLHYTIMPLGGFCFAHLFGLHGAVATGLVLIGSVPIVITNVAIAIINVWFLRNELGGHRTLGATEVPVDAPFLVDFLQYHLADIRRFHRDGHLLETIEVQYTLRRETDGRLRMISALWCEPGWRSACLTA